MAKAPRMTLTGTVLSAPDVPLLAGFYRELLGWEVAQDEPDWVKLTPPGGGASVAVQHEESYTRPRWPAEDGRQQMMLHLDIEVDDLASATAYAVSLGAEVAAFQPQDDVRVCLDPAGHPFCLWVATD